MRHMWNHENKDKEDYSTGVLDKCGSLCHMVCEKCKSSITIGRNEMSGITKMAVRINYNNDWKNFDDYDDIFKLNQRSRGCTISDSEYYMRELLK